MIENHEASDADVELFNQLGVRPVKRKMFEFVEFPGFGEVKLKNAYFIYTTK
jgi:hypothetical protein